MSAPFGKREPLTPMQRFCLGVIAEFHADLGRSPTFRELRDELDLRSLENVTRLVRALTDKGHLRRRRRGARYALVPAADVVLPAEGPVEMTPAGEALLAGRAA